MDTLPPPALGCLVCHEEGTIARSQRRNLQDVSGQYTHLTCSSCGSTALLDWDEAQPDAWRIRYTRVPLQKPYTYAAIKFNKAGWLEADEALDLSTEIFVHRERLTQAERG